jgi:GNAT superfamily N-acetyltransferase
MHSDAAIGPPKAAEDSTSLLQIIYETEKLFWSLLARPCELGGILRYQSNSPLNEGYKIVVEDTSAVDELRSELAHGKVRRLVFAPTCRGDEAVGNMLVISVGNALLTPDGSACFYMLAHEQAKHAFAASDEYRIDEVHPRTVGKDRAVVHMLRHAKDTHIRDPEIQTALLRWVDDRIDRIDGYRTWVMYHHDQPIGTLSAFRYRRSITRIRDLFITPDYQGRGLSKHLLTEVMSALEPPFAVVTDTDNTARFAYLGRRLYPIYLQKAFGVSYGR